MKKLDLPHIIGVLANAAVFGGLVFLGFETRQNTVQLRSAASYSITEGLNQLNAGIYDNPVLADIVYRGEQDLSALNPVERSQFAAWEFARINLALHIQVLEEDGVADVQFPYIEFLVDEYQRKPGLRQFAASIEDVWQGSPELYRRLRGENP